MAGLTFDTGALIKLEQQRPDMRKVVDTAIQHNVIITVPAIVVAEWWRAGSGLERRSQLLRMVIVEPLNQFLAQIAGQAVGQVPGSQAIHAIVMASASQRGVVVYASDLPDLERLWAAFPKVKRIEPT